jgi:hypothetical protein
MHTLPRQHRQWGPMSEILLIRLNQTISAHWNQFAQKLSFLAISPNSGGFAYFLHKCGGILELTLILKINISECFKQKYNQTSSTTPSRLLKG